MPTNASGTRTASSTKLLLATCVAVGASLALGSTRAGATTLFQDNFTGSSTVSADGTTPTQAKGIAPQPVKWNLVTGARTGFGAGGSIGLNGGDFGGDYLTYNFMSGFIYTLSAKLDPGPGGEEAISFGTKATGDLPGPTMIVDYQSANTAGLQYLASGDISSLIDTIPKSESYGGTARIDFNTISPHWSAIWYYNNIELGYHIYNTNPTGINGFSISAISTGTSPFTGDIKSFLVTEAPEPASLGLFGAGAVGLLLSRRRNT